MLKLILGRAFSGKSTYIRNIIAEKAEKGEKIILVVPEQFSFESERIIIEMLGAKKAAEVSILSFTSLSKRILDEYMPDRKPPVTDAAKNVLMSMTLEALSEKLSVFGKCAKSMVTVSQIMQITDELIQYDVSPSELIRAAELSGNSILIQKANEIELISSLYSQMLSEKFSDDRCMINAATEIIREKKLFEGKTVIFDEFSGFKAQQMLLLDVLFTQAEDVYITMWADSVKDLSMGTGPLSYSVDKIQKLIQLAKMNSVAVAEPVILSNDGRYSSPAIATLEKGIYEPNPEIYENDAPEITLATAKNIYDECDFAAMTAKKLVREKGYRYRDIVIVSRGNDYAKHLPFALKKYDIPVFEDTRHALETEIIVIFTLSALTIAAEGFSTDTMLRYLKTYLSGISEDDIMLLENYVLMWHTDYSAWLNDWTGHPDGIGNEFDDDAKERLSYINDIRRRAVMPLITLRKNMTDTDALSCTKAVYQFLMDTKADKNLLEFASGLDNDNAYSCERSWDELMNVLSLFAETVGERSITPLRFLELFRIMIASSDIGDLPSGLDEITIGDADRIRVADKKVLFIVGANDGVFPAGATPSYILTDNERRLLKNQNVELGTDATDEARKERLIVYTTMSIPREMLFVSYATGNIKGDAGAPSEIISMLLKIIPRCTKTDISLLGAADTIESGKSAFESAAGHFTDTDVFSQSVKEFISSHDEYSDRLAAVKRAITKDKITITNKSAAEKLFGREMYISPSRVEEYYKCPFKYFCRYGLKASALNNVAFDPRQTGLMVHFVLEKLFAAYGSKGLVTLTPRERKIAVEKETENYIETHIGEKTNISQRVLYSLYRCRNTIVDILERLVNEFSMSEFETRDVELRIGNDGKVPSYKIDIPEGGSISLMGVVDRIDTMISSDSGKTYLRVIDYKSGGKDFNLNDIMSGLNIQMLVYLMCLFENGKERYGDFIPAGVLYVPAKNAKNELGRNACDEDIQALQIKHGVMKGIVLCEEEVIRGMDKDGNGALIEAGIKSDGTITGKVFSMEQFTLLHKKVDELIASMATSLLDGNVEAYPVTEGAYKHTCTYCDYRSVCGREDTDESKPLFSGDIWEELGGEDNG
ncbi:MAG: PD-(D/E)XK nuclease family protein [Clostridia bacterium]|nr:PD-(D/E)XK nuclease family protein [Clostridia bacterium]